MKEVRGFTLLELLMVVIIIAILASIALPQFARNVLKARRSEALQVLATIRGAELRYRADSTAFTANLDLLDTDFSLPASSTNMARGSWNYSVTTAASEVKAVGFSGVATTCTEAMNILTGGLTIDHIGALGNNTSC